MTAPDSTDLYKRYRSADDVVMEILEDMGLDADDNYMLYRGKVLRWVFRGNLYMGAPITYERQPYTGFVENCMVKKPCDFVKLMEVRLSRCHVMPMYAPKNKFMCDKGCVNFNPEFYQSHYTVSESHTSIDFSSNANGEPVYMEYLSYKHDENGVPMIDSTYYEAIVAFCRYKYAATRNDTRENEFFSKYEYMARKARGRYVAMAIDNYFVDQVLAKFSDPLYVKQSQYGRDIQNYNTARIHGGIMGASSNLNVLNRF